MDDKKRTVQLEAVMNAKKKGVTAIKVELEAALGRRNRVYDDNYVASEGMRRCQCTDGMITCPTCNGNSEHQCTACNGNGYNNDVSCGVCAGGGWTACQNDLCENGRNACAICEGDGEIPIDSNSVFENLNWCSEDVCFEWLMNRIAKKLEWTDEQIGGRFDRSGYTDMINPFEWMKFAKFYNDGSVDSELTFTVKLDNPENVFKIPLVIEAFVEMAAAMGSEMNVKGAGMHTAFIWHPTANYPSSHDDYPVEQYSDSRRLDSLSLKHYKKAVTQLLPALYLLGTTNEISRGLNYRLPKVVVDYRAESRSGNAKYAAITYRQGAMEFRLFDTCYDNIPAFLDNVVVMCNTLKYLSPKYKSPGIAGKVAGRMAFGNDSNDKLERLYSTVHHLEALNIGLERIKPSYYTIKEIKAARSFAKNKRVLKKLVQERIQRAENEFKEYNERFNWEIKVRIMRARAQYMEELVRQKKGEELQQLSEAEVDAQLTEKLTEYETSYESRRKTATKYVKERLKVIENQEVGQYTLQMAA